MALRYLLSVVGWAYRQVRRLRVIPVKIGGPSDGLTVGIFIVVAPAPDGSRHNGRED